MMTLSAFALLAFGLYQVIEALVYYRPMERIETHKFIHAFYSRREGIRYEALYERAVSFRERAARLKVQYHMVIGGAAIIMGALVLALLADTRGVHAKEAPTPVAQ